MAYSTVGSLWRRTLLRTLWMGCSVGVILYSMLVLSRRTDNYFSIRGSTGRASYI